MDEAKRDELNNLIVNETAEMLTALGNKNFPLFHRRLSGVINLLIEADVFPKGWVLPSILKISF